MVLYYLPKKLNTLKAGNQAAHFHILKSESMKAIKKFAERLGLFNFSLLQDVPDSNAYKLNNGTKVSRDPLIGNQLLLWRSN